MSNLLLVIVKYTGYISIVKLIAFVVLFFLSLPLISWVYKDSEQVGTKQTLWTSIVLAVTASAVVIWLLVPVFVIGMAIYMTAVGIVAVGYLRHRNGIVMEFDRILTADHITNLISRSREKEAEHLKDFTFITANDNEIPVPQPKTEDFYGYKAAFDILSDAVRHRASDIAFTPTQQDYKVAYIIDGVTLKRPDAKRQQVEHFIHFIKNLADLDAKEKRKPQKGDFKVRREQKETLQWEVITSGSTVGEQVRLRRLAQQGVIRLADIGLMDDQYEMLNKIRQEKQGLFLISGPKKSGVTTTFYTLLRNHDAFLNSIDILERNPSADLPNITQNVFSLTDTGTTTYAKRLLRIARMGPDVIGAADCLDGESAKIACNAAKDGKIVYVTIEADSVINALGTWIKLVGSREQAVENLLGISNQRLIRKLCDQCKQAYTPNSELLRKFNLPAEKVKVLYRTGKVQYSKHGKEMTCENCHGIGYIDRIGIFEIVSVTDQLKEGIKKSKSLSEIDTHLRHAKMLYLQQQILKRVIDGTTSVNEMIRIISTRKPKNRK